MTKKTLAIQRAEYSQIRRLLALGLSNDQIIESIHMPYSTYMKILRKIMLEDEDRMLAQAHHGLALAINTIKERLARSAQNLSNIARDKDIAVRERIDAEMAVVSINQLLLKLEGEQAVIATNRQLIQIDNQISQLQRNPQLTNRLQPAGYHTEPEAIPISILEDQPRDVDTINDSNIERTDEPDYNQRKF